MGHFFQRGDLTVKKRSLRDPLKRFRKRKETLWPNLMLTLGKMPRIMKEGFSKNRTLFTEV